MSDFPLSTTSRRRYSTVTVFVHITNLLLLDSSTLDLDTGTVAGTSASTSAYLIEKCIKPEHRKFLPKFVEVEGTTSELPTSENLEVIKLLEEQNIVYIPKKVQDKQALVLVPPMQKYSYWQNIVMVVGIIARIAHVTTKKRATYGNMCASCV